MAKEKNRKFTVQDRRKVYGLKKIKDTSKPVSIPPKNELKKRRKIVAKNLQKQMFFCPAIGENVLMDYETINHLRGRSTGSVRSFKSLFMIKDILLNATKIFDDTPKNNKTQKLYVKTTIFICPIKMIGYAKVVIGELREEKKIEKGVTNHLYSVSVISLRKMKK